jgi:hypothetical protein
MLAQIFKDANFKVVRTKLLYDDSGKSKCAGYVDFESSEAAS